jgi:hypothetical protein
VDSVDNSVVDSIARNTFTKVQTLNESKRF